MELPVRVEESVHRVATRSSTKNRAHEHKHRRAKIKTRSSRLDNPSSSSDPEPEPELVQPRATFEKGVEERRIPRDISIEVRDDLEKTNLGVVTEPKKVRFDDIPVIIEPEVKPDDYDIIQDIKDQKANVTIGQLLYVNANYQKLIREEWTKKRKRRLKLPSVAVNFAKIEDYGAPKIVVEVDGCIMPKVPIDGGSGVNLMLEDTAFDLGYTSFEETNQILRMADQSKVIPAGQLSQVPTRIGEVTYLQNFVIIRVSTRKPFPMLLGRPWLYSAKVLVDWGAKEFIVGKPPLRIPWKAEKYLGETSESDAYTSGWSDPEDSDSVPSYFVTEFSGATEEDFGFSNPIPEEGCQVIEESGDGVLRPEDRSLGTTDVPLTLEWIQGQVSQGSLPAIGLKEHQQDTPWSEIRARMEESKPNPVKNIVSPTDYEKMEVEAGKTFYRGGEVSIL